MIWRKTLNEGGGSLRIYKNSNAAPGLCSPDPRPRMASMELPHKKKSCSLALVDIWGDATWRLGEVKTLPDLARRISLFSQPISSMLPFET